MGAASLWGLPGNLEAPAPPAAGARQRCTHQLHVGRHAQPQRGDEGLLVLVCVFSLALLCVGRRHKASGGGGSDGAPHSKQQRGGHGVWLWPALPVLCHFSQKRSPVFHPAPPQASTPLWPVLRWGWGGVGVAGGACPRDCGGRLRLGASALLSLPFQGWARCGDAGCVCGVCAPAWSRPPAGTPRAGSCPPASLVCVRRPHHATSEFPGCQAQRRVLSSQRTGFPVEPRSSDPSPAQHRPPSPATGVPSPSPALHWCLPRSTAHPPNFLTPRGLHTRATQEVRADPENLGKLTF